SWCPGSGAHALEPGVQRMAAAAPGRTTAAGGTFRDQTRSGFLRLGAPRYHRSLTSSSALGGLLPFPQPGASAKDREGRNDQNQPGGHRDGGGGAGGGRRPGEVRLIADGQVADRELAINAEGNVRRARGQRGGLGAAGNNGGARRRGD